MAANELENMFSSILKGLRDMTDVNTVVGNPIETSDGTVIIPVSKVSFGFGMGGWDGALAPDKNNLSGGGGGGVSVAPVGFLVVSNGNVKMLNVDTATPLEKVIETLPELVKSMTGLFGKSND
ncbi:MAG: GerW family sporulation protein [Eubacteriales bacterium]|jgi:sporulation protein YtfJ|nr:GerW family sporulation protein [Eubacteriales bacterium]